MNSLLCFRFCKSLNLTVCRNDCYELLRIILESYFPSVVPWTRAIAIEAYMLRFYMLFAVVAAPERVVTRALFTVYGGVSYGALFAMDISRSLFYLPTACRRCRVPTSADQEAAQESS